MSLASKRASYIPILYFQVMHPQTLQSQLTRVYCFNDISPSHSHLMLRIITLHHTCQLEVTNLHEDFTQGVHIFSTAIAVLGPSGSPVHYTRHRTLTHSFPHNLPSPSTNGFCTLWARVKTAQYRGCTPKGWAMTITPRHQIPVGGLSLIHISEPTRPY